MLDPTTGVWSEIFNGEAGYPDANSFIKRSLKTGLAYQFKVKAAYLNGYTDESSSGTVYTCTTPTSIDAPKFVTATSTSMTLSWSQPATNGGCSVEGFRLYRNDG